MIARMKDYGISGSGLDILNTNLALFTYPVECFCQSICFGFFFELLTRLTTLCASIQRSGFYRLADWSPIVSRSMFNYVDLMCKYLLVYVTKYINHEAMLHQSSEAPSRSSKIINSSWATSSPTILTHASLIISTVSSSNARSRLGGGKLKTWGEWV